MLENVVVVAFDHSLASSSFVVLVVVAPFEQQLAEFEQLEVSTEV